MKTNKSKIVLILIVCAIVATGYILLKKESTSGDSKKNLLVTQTGSPRERNLETIISIQDENGKVNVLVQVPQANVRDIKLSPDGKYVGYSIIEIVPSQTGLVYTQKISIKSTSGNDEQKSLNDINAGLREINSVNYYQLVGWSQDNKHLYALKVNDIQGGWQDKGLYAIDINTKEITTQELSEEILVGATLSPNGRQLAFIPYKSTSGHTFWSPFEPETIKVLDIASGSKRDIVTSPNSIDFNSLKWSVDGKTIFYKLNGSTNILEVEIEK